MVLPTEHVHKYILPSPYQTVLNCFEPDLSPECLSRFSFASILNGLRTFPIEKEYFEFSASQYQPSYFGNSCGFCVCFFFVFFLHDTVTIIF